MKNSKEPINKPFRMTALSLEEAIALDKNAGKALKALYEKYWELNPGTHLYECSDLNAWLAEKRKIKSTMMLLRPGSQTGREPHLQHALLLEAVV